jgi:hypothetical protein
MDSLGNPKSMRLNVDTVVCARRVLSSAWLILIAMAGDGVVSESSSAEWQIAPPAATRTKNLAVDLPPLAVVESRDDSGKTWQVSGRVSGSPSVAREDFKLCLQNQGWRLDKVIALGFDKQTPNASAIGSHQ